jgi:hypothetical protein
MSRVYKIVEASIPIEASEMAKSSLSSRGSCVTKITILPEKMVEDVVLY